MIDVSGVTFRYVAAAAALTFPDWQVAPGAHCLLLGNSGSGKTTLLHLLAGFLKPTTGRVVVGDQNLSTLSEAQLDRYRGRSIGLVFQRPHLIASLTVTQNLQLAQYLAGLPSQPDLIAETLATLQLTHRSHARPATLSQGEAQRAALARALLNRPRVILADEPTSSLDDDNCNRVLDLLRQQAERYEATLIIATHDQRLKQLMPEQQTLFAP